MDTVSSNPTGVQPLPVELSALLRADDQAAFDAALDELLRHREQSIFRALGALARDLHEAIKRLTQDISHTPGEPASLESARLRLQEVLEMGARAAHQNLDLVERLRPQAQALTAHAETALGTVSANGADHTLASEAAAFGHTCQAAFSTMVIEQSWQDLAGQRVKQVDAFIGRVDVAMRELVQLTGSLSGARLPDASPRVANQDDVDRMLAEFGF
ncbi:protein phosphatase CheZ [Frateuria aurantia]